MSRGLQRERDLVNRLRDEGWWAIRSPASKGEVDVVAIKYVPAGDSPFRVVRHPYHAVQFIEVKSTAAGPYSHFGPSDRDALIAEADKAGAQAILCWWPPRKQPQFIPASDWP